MPSTLSDSSRRGGLLGKLLIVLTTFVVLLAVVWMLFLPAIVRSVLQRRTQFDVGVQKLTINPFTARVHLQGLVLRNPEGFPLPEFVNLREARADIALFSLFGDRLIVEDAAIDLAQLALVKNAAGQSNALLFKERLLGPEKPDASPEKPATKTTKSQPFLIRHLELRFDQILLAEVSNAAKPRILDLNFSHTYENVDSPTQLVGPVLVQLTTRSGILNRLLDKIGVGGADSASKTQELLRGVFPSLDQTPKK